MIKIVAWAVLLPATLVVIAFAVANRHDVRLSLDPLPFDFEVPLYGLALAFVFLGLLIGGFTAWAKALRWRRRAAEARRRALRLEDELRVERDKLAAATAEAQPPAIVDAA